mgnify:FL=1
MGTFAASRCGGLQPPTTGTQLSFDSPSMGMLVEFACGDMYGRNYDYKGLADAIDFLVVMDYDSNSPVIFVVVLIDANEVIQNGL